MSETIEQLRVRCAREHIRAIAADCPSIIQAAAAHRRLKRLCDRMGLNYPGSIRCWERLLTGENK